MLHNPYAPIFIVHDMNANFFLFRRNSSTRSDGAPSTSPTGSTMSSMLCWETCNIVTIDATIRFDLEIVFWPASFYIYLHCTYSTEIWDFQNGKIISILVWSVVWMYSDILGNHNEFTFFLNVIWIPVGYGYIRSIRSSLGFICPSETMCGGLISVKSTSQIVNSLLNYK